MNCILCDDVLQCNCFDFIKTTMYLFYRPDKLMIVACNFPYSNDEFCCDMLTAVTISGNRQIF